MTFDTRNQTEYGTLRTYIASGITTTNGNNATGTTYNNRAFIQWAGFTMGLASSFYSFMQFSQFSNQTNIIGADTGGNGIMLWAYTAQLGNGLSASISLEDSNHGYRRKGIADNFSSLINGNGALGTDHYAGTGTRWPDIVGNIRLEQAWGGAQIMGAIHDVAANYYSFPFGTTEWSGHPGDEVGWAIGGGLKINLPMLGHGDYVAMQATYTKGALGYAGSGLPTGAFMIYSGQEAGVGPSLDAVYSSGQVPAGSGQSGLELTEAWSFGGGLNHHWNSQWQTSLYGGYVAIKFNDTATSFMNYTQVLPQGTNWDSSFWQIGSRTKWTPTKGLDLSVDVMYNHLNTAWDNLPNGTTAMLGAMPPGKVNQPYIISDQDVWQGIFRVQRNFYP